MAPDTDWNNNWGESKKAEIRMKNHQIGNCIPFNFASPKQIKFHEEVTWNLLFHSTHFRDRTPAKLRMLQLFSDTYGKLWVIHVFKFDH